jgi:hypothetical protein
LRRNSGVEAFAGLGFGFIHKCIITSFNYIPIRIEPIELGYRSKTIPETYCTIPSINGTADDELSTLINRYTKTGIEDRQDEKF